MNGSQDQRKNQKPVQIKNAGLLIGIEDAERKKKCRICGVEKELSEFNKKIGSSDGLRHECKPCIKKWKANHYQRNKKEISKKYSEYYAKNKEKLDALNSANYHRNKLKINAELSERRKNDVCFRLASNIRSRINDALKPTGTAKYLKTMELVGCTIKELKTHIEKQFTCDMAWKHYHFYGIQTDHIRPCSSFDLTDPEQQKQCFHYSNMQPLWAKDNYKKGTKYEAT